MANEKVIVDENTIGSLKRATVAINSSPAVNRGRAHEAGHASLPATDVKKDDLPAGVVETNKRRFLAAHLIAETGRGIIKLLNR